MKLKTILIILLLTIPIAWSLEECKKITEPEDIPCRVTTTWPYTSACGSYSAQIINDSGVILNTVNLTDFGSSGLCNFTFNYTEKGSYIYNITSGDSGNITVEVKNLMLGIIIGIGIICGIFLWLSFSLDNSHLVLKLFLIFEVITLLSVIPATFILHDTSVLFHTVYIRFLWVFWIYVSVYFIYKVLLWLGLVSQGETEDEA